MRRIARYASAMFIVEGAFTAFTQVDVIVIGAYLSSADVAFFQAPSRLTTLLAYPGLALSAGVSPRLSFGGDGPDVRSLERSLRYLFIVQAALIPPIVVWARPLTDLLLGASSADSAGRPASARPLRLRLRLRAAAFGGCQLPRRGAAASTDCDRCRGSATSIIDLILVPRSGRSAPPSARTSPTRLRRLRTSGCLRGSCRCVCPTSVRRSSLRDRRGDSRWPPCSAPWDLWTCRLAAWIVGAVSGAARFRRR